MPNSAEFLAIIRRLSDGERLSPEEIMDRIAEEHPEAEMADVMRALEAFVDELGERSQEAADHLCSLQPLAALLENEPDGTPLIEVLRKHAMAGDEYAKSVLAQLESPAYRRSQALFRAAVEKHPNWRREGCRFIHSGGGPETPDALVEWFQMNHPREASEIERSANG